MEIHIVVILSSLLLSVVSRIHYVNTGVCDIPTVVCNVVTGPDINRELRLNDNVTELWLLSGTRNREQTQY